MRADHTAAAIVVTLDGPAGSGKSTVARRLAERLGFRFLDTGAMYRAATLAVLRAGVSLDPLDEADLLRAIDAADISLDESGRVLLGGRVVEAEIRTREVTAWVSQVSAIPALRARMVQLQRRFGEQDGSGLVAEGRDMATVVFPTARHRFYLEAAVAVRADRRLGDLRARGLAVPERGQLVAEIEERDRRDSNRAVAPLRVADGARIIDTTHLSIDEVVDRLERHVLPGAVR